MRQPIRSEKPPGIVATLSAGFDLTTSKIWLILLPILLDLFYWLGPRLSIRTLVESNLSYLASEPPLTDLVEQMSQLAADINLFTSLSIPIIGIPALMSGPIPEKTPVAPVTLQVQETAAWFGSFLLISIAGLMLTAVYLGMIGWALKSSENGLWGNPKMILLALFRVIYRLLALGLIFMAILLAFALPVLPAALLLSIVSANLAMLTILTVFILVVTFLSLSVPGIVFGERGVLSAVLDSVRLVRNNLSQTMSLLFTILIINSGMNFLWHLADDGSWLTLVSIVGHAFITTALAVAIFIFYRDRISINPEVIQEKRKGL